MKKFISAKVAQMEKDEEIKKILQNNDKILVGLMMFITTQFILLISIF